MTEIGPPPSEVLAAFAVRGPLTRLSGGEARAFATARAVLKPADDAVEASWIADRSLEIEERDFRLARPLRTQDGSWVVQSWTAWERLDGVHEPGRWPEIFVVSDALHAALATVSAPPFLAARTDPWASADRIAWSVEASVEVSSQFAGVLDRLVVYRSWFLGHFASGNHAAAPVLGKSAWRTAAGVRWPWRSTSQAWL